MAWLHGLVRRSDVLSELNRHGLRRAHCLGVVADRLRFIEVLLIFIDLNIVLRIAATFAIRHHS